MKNSGTYSRKIREFYRSSKIKGQEPEKVTYDEPVDALVYAVISEDITQGQAHSTMHRLKEHFVDSNDLRVSRTDEIADVIGGDAQAAMNTASAIVRVLTAVFIKYNVVSLNALKKMGKRPAKQFLEKMDGITRFAVDYCMLTSLQGHAIPLTKKMVEYLKNNKMVYPSSDEQEIEGFLARQISAESAYEFYALLRLQSESGKTETKGKKKASRKTKDKTES
jgi:endonuclease III